jgi:hypothetical protein
MTSASVWPAAQVAFSHSRMAAMLMTGTDTGEAWQKIEGCKRRNGEV